MTSNPSRTIAEPTGLIGPELERTLRAAVRNATHGIRLAPVGSKILDADPFFTQLPVPALAVDAETLRILAVNDAAVVFYGYGRDTLLQQTLQDLRPIADRIRLLGGALDPECPNHLVAGGREVTAPVRTVRIDTLARPAVLMTLWPQPGIPSIGQHPAEEPHDLPDRASFTITMQAALLRGARYGEQAAVLRLRLGGGGAEPEPGERLLGQACGRFQALLCGRDVAARFGRQDLAVLQTSVDSTASPRALAALIIAELGELGLGVSVGIARAPADGQDPETLLRHAEVALSRAVAAGRGTVRLFEASMNHPGRVLADA